MPVLPAVIYQCKDCKKVIAKLNPNIRANNRASISLVRADTDGPFSFPQGWCQFCKTEYCISKEELINTGSLDKKAKNKLGKDIQVEIEVAKEIEEPAEEILPDTGPVLSKKEKFLKDKKGK